MKDLNAPFVQHSGSLERYLLSEDSKTVITPGVADVIQTYRALDIVCEIAKMSESNTEEWMLAYEVKAINGEATITCTNGNEEPPKTPIEPKVMPAPKMPDGILKLWRFNDMVNAEKDADYDIPPVVILPSEY